MTPTELSDYAYDCGFIAPDSPEPDYRYVVKLVLRATLFFRDGHTPATRQALKACFDDYFTAFGKDLRWGWDPQPVDKPTPWRFDEQLVNASNGAFASTKADDNLVLGFMGGLNPHYVGDNGIECLTRPDWEQAIGRDSSYLTFWVACDSFQKGQWDGGAFPMHDFVLNCCNRLNATQGYAGFALALPHEYARWEPYELELAQRYYGLEIDNPINTIGMIQNWRGIKSVNWYTVLGGHYVQKLGGEQALRSQLTDPLFRFYELSGGGLVIRAGDGPEMAPIAHGAPPLYIAVNEVIRPVRTAEIRSMGMGSNAGELRFNQRLTDLWLRRFDGPRIWPPFQP